MEAKNNFIKIYIKNRLTINVLLIPEVRKNIFSRAKHMGHFEGFFEGSKRSLPPPLEKSLEILHYMFRPRQKKIIPCTFRIRGTLVFLNPKERERGKRGRERDQE
jgi:hypothetical protein